MNINLLCIKDCNLPEQVVKNTCVNLLQVKSSADTAELLNEIQDILLDKQRFILSSAALLNSIIEGRGLQYIIEIGYQLLGNPIMLGDTNYRLLAHSKNEEVDDPAWNELVAKGYCSYDFATRYKFKELIEQEIKSGTPFIADAGAAEKKRRILAKITIDNKIVGHLAVLEHNKPFTESDIEITAFICDVISSEMQKNSHFLNTKAVIYENLITDLLNGINQNENLIQERINHFEWKIKDKLYVLSIDIGGLENSFTLIPYIRDSLGKMMEGENAVIYDNRIVIILGCSKEKSLTKSDFQPLISFLRKNNMSAGLSQCFNKITDLKEYYKQSISSIDIGLRINKNDVLYVYDDYSLYHMINILNHYENIARFCHPALLQLLEYDNKHKTDYVKSLYTYIVNARNLISAADSLFIHRNTMSYRIAKIQEISGIDLNNNDLLMHIFVSYKILKYSGRL
ncbi:helix-turn-helix domain-containing protein [Clostridium sp. SYSU_GA19001]|uniref:PucR family transcriptional regulator n=1 Tax=Clostridium caldaquaticum TaxID=2940653 RepID=UPI0020774BEE|nr:helix-turn-helix domain-containing protein [Clostridium caldaquaticum]MCM8709589.1 helix-turn-helix domain-containing protein [Clostridium caldaquaticum]